MYREIVIETYRAVNEPSHHNIRARPVAGQGLDTSMNVECSSEMREGCDPGTKLKVRAKITNREDGTPFLYTHYKWDYQILSNEEAAAFIRARHETS